MAQATDDASWPQFFISLFEAFFFPNDQRYISIKRSLLSTTAFLFVAAGIATLLLGIEAWGKSDLLKEIRKGELALIFGLLCMNFVGDYFSLYESWAVIKLMAKRKSSVFGKAFYLMLDAYLTMSISILAPLIVIGLPLFLLTEGLKGFSEKIIQIILFAIVVLFGGPFFVPVSCFLDAPSPCTEPLILTVVITSFFTSIWLWVFIISSTLTRFVKGTSKSKPALATATHDPFPGLVVAFSVVTLVVFLLILPRALWA